MSTITKLIETIREMGLTPFVIEKIDWKFSDVIPHLSKSCVANVGCGEFGTKFPAEVVQEKWHDAFGVMQIIKATSQAQFTVIPKLPVYNKKVVAASLQCKQPCTNCGTLSEHVK